MIEDREDQRAVEFSQPTLRAQLLRFMLWPHLASTAVLITIAILGHVYAFRNGETVVVPAIVIVSCYVVWVIYALALAPKFVERWCKRLVVPPEKRIRYYASSWTDSAIEFDTRARYVTMVAVPAMTVAWRGQWYLMLPLLLPALLHASSAVILWRKLSL